MRLAFEAAGGRCIFTCEWDTWCHKTYRANFGDRLGISATSPESNWNPCPTMTCSWPASPASLSALRACPRKIPSARPHGFECATQGTLFFDVVRILKARRPRAFLLENVKNLLSHDKRRTFGIIRGALEELGYTLSPKWWTAARGFRSTASAS